MSPEDIQQWAHGAVSCNDCGHRWIGVWKLGADALECPNCHSTDTERDAEPSKPQEN